ncbi:SufBD protein [Sporanaerobium hydrogeniformans]|uniref:SufBD protein n=2 Tax=Sporanaerobium hydrogeniformans TaxID=3072179 RepID=A0AC61DAS8_9FIRM|nr:SufBD protein [Sporanaerobium hydrogeniformans]
MDSDNKKAYQCLKLLENESYQSDAVYPFFNVFADMLDNENSYIRTRGIILISVNAQWDSDHKIDEIIDKYLKHITDDKPITARQCIKVLPIIAKYKPDLRQDILNALHRAHPTRYKESMQSLVVKDIQKCVNNIQKL